MIATRGKHNERSRSLSPYFDALPEEAHEAVL
jgi:hypothetical protein